MAWTARRRSPAPFWHRNRSPRLVKGINPNDSLANNDGHGFFEASATLS
jgi:hypothetical protein